MSSGENDAEERALLAFGEWICVQLATFCEIFV
jgi:hypothetical protein